MSTESAAYKRLDYLWRVLMGRESGRQWMQSHPPVVQRAMVMEQLEQRLLMSATPGLGAGPGAGVSAAVEVKLQNAIAQAVERVNALSAAADLNSDGVVNVTDLNMLYTAIGGAISSGDLNGDGLVNSGDLDVILLDGMHTQRGDSDLDGDVDSQDLSVLRSHLGLSDLGWGGGDFNADGHVDATDLSLLRGNLGAAAPTGAAHVAAVLLNDTGASDSDGVTTDAGVYGQVLNPQQMVTLLVGLDGAQQSQYLDITAGVGADGRFILDGDVLLSLAPGGINSGPHTAHFKLLNALGDLVDHFALDFIYQQQPNSPLMAMQAASQSLNAPFTTPLDHFGHPETLVYDNFVNNTISTADGIQAYAIELQGGQSVQFWSEPTGANASSLRLQARLVDVSGGNVVMSQVEATLPGQFVVNGPIQITHSGTYQIEITALEGASSYYTELQLNSSWEMPAGGVLNLDDTSLQLSPGVDRLNAYAWFDSDLDQYSFTATAGVPISIDAKLSFANNPAPTLLTLKDENSVVVATGVAGENRQFISNFTPASSGLYTVEVTGRLYTLTITRGISFDTEGNDDPVTSPSLGSSDSVLGGLINTYARTVGASNPVAYWRLGESSGTTAADATGHGHDGFYAGGVQLGTDGPSATDLNTAATFDGFNDLVSVPNDAALSPVNTITLEMWLNPDEEPNFNTTQYALSKVPFNTTSQGYGIGRNSNTGLFFWFGNYSIFLDGAMTPGEWTHVAATVQGQTMNLYINGELRQSQNWFGTNTVTNQPLRIGSGFNTGRWNGSIDDVAIYDRALSAQEVAAHYNTDDSVDFYRVDVAGGDNLTILTTTPLDQLTGEPINQLDVKVELYDANGSLVAGATGGAADGRNVSMNYLVGAGAGGAYHVAVRSQHGGGAYTLKVQGATGAANDSIATAQNLDPTSVALLGTADRLGLTTQKLALDQVYSFTASAGQPATIGLRLLEGDAPSLSLLASDGTVLATGEKGITNFNSIIRDFPPAANGPLFIRVAGGVGARYELVVGRGATPEVEPNNNDNDARNITPTGQVFGTVGGQTPVVGPPGADVTSFNHNLFDGEGFRWDIERSGSISDGSSDAYDGGLYLYTYDFATNNTRDFFDNSGSSGGGGGGGNEASSAAFSPGNMATTEEAGRELVFGPQLLSQVPVTVARKVYISPTEGFARYLESFTNDTASTLSFGMLIQTNFGSDGSTQYIATSSGDTSFGSNDLWVITDDSTPGFGNSDPTLLHMIGGAGAAVSPIAVEGQTSNDNFRWGYQLTLAPGETKTIMHLAAQNVTQAAAFGKVNGFLNGDIDILAGMTSQEIDRVVNFKLSDSVDQYTFAASEGDVLTIQTATPGGAGNTLDPLVRLYDPSGVEVALNDNGAPDGRNALLQYVVPVGGGGIYRVKIVDALGQGEGDYSLRVTGNTGLPASVPFKVEQTSLADGSTVTQNPTQLVLAFDGGISAASLQISDLQLSGGLVTGFELLSGNQVAFHLDLSGVGGAWTYSLAAGAINSIDGRASQAFSATINLDTAGAHVTYQSPASTIGSFSYIEIGFDRQINQNTVTIADVLSFTGPHGENLLPQISFFGVSSTYVYIYLNSTLTETGAYALTLGPDILDMQGRPMDNNLNGIGGEAADSYTAIIAIPSVDLALSQFSAPPTAEVGTSIQLNYHVDNLSASPVPQYYYDVLYLSDDAVLDGGDRFLENFYTDQTEAPLPGTGKDFTRNMFLPVNLTAGNKFLILTTNGYQYFQDPNQANNTQVIPIQITVPPPPAVDLTVTAATPSLSTVNLGQSFNIQWTVFNSGGDAGTADWYDRVWISADNILNPQTDQYVTERYAGNETPLNGTSGYTVSVGTSIFAGSNTPIGNVFLIVQADTYGQQTESDESNNYLAIPFTLNGVDLVVQTATAPASVLWGSTVNVSWTGQNAGGQTATATNWQDQVIYSTDMVLGGDLTFRTETHTNSPQLVGGGTYTAANRSITFGNSSIPLGNGFLGFRIDTNFRQNEVNDNNNVFWLPIQVLGGDQEMTSFNAPSQMVNGQLVTFDYQVSNISPNNILNYSTIEFRLSSDSILSNDDIYIYSDSIEPLVSGQSQVRSLSFHLPGNLPAGDWKLLAIADRYANIPETNEANNLLVRDVHIDNPDLTIQNLIAPASAVLGSQITANFDLVNIGGVASLQYHYTRMFISDDPFRDETDIEIGSQSEDIDLGPGSSVQRSLLSYNMTDSRITAGDRFLIVEADGYNYVSETNESNNFLVRPIHLDAPDLIITQATAPATGIPNQTFNVSFTVKNDSPFTTTNHWNDYVFLSSDPFLGGDTYLGSAYSYYTRGDVPFNPGDTYVVSFNVTLPSNSTGERFLIFVTDRDQYQGESNEQNNTFVLPISISSPDLVVQAATAPGSAVTGSSINLSWTVLNQGSTPAPGNWSDLVYLSTDEFFGGDIQFEGDFIDTQTPLAVNGAYTISKSGTLPSVAAGNYFLFFRVDGFNQQGETNENNNLFSIPITINAPNLTIQTDQTPLNAFVNQTMNVTYTVTNASADIPANSDWYDRILLSSDEFLGGDTFLTDVFVGSLSPLGPGGSYTRSQSFTLPSNQTGPRFLLIQTDPYGNQGETNDSDNFIAIPITIVTPPNLQVSSASVSPNPAVVNSSAQVTYTVNNVGQDAAAGDWTDRIYLYDSQNFDGSGVLVGTRSIIDQTPLAGGGAGYTVTADINLPAGKIGNKFLAIVANDFHEQGETDFNDNVLFIPITINAPNLQVTNVISPPDAVVSQTFDITYTVTNNSLFPANADWFDQIFLSNDQFIGSDQELATAHISAQTPLAPGDSYTRTQSVTLPAGATGPRFLIIRTDAFDSQGETNNNDNILIVPISISPPPNLTVTAGSVTPNTASVQQSVTVQYTAANIGANPAVADWTDHIYLTQSNIIDGTSILLGSHNAAGDSPLNPSATYDASVSVTLPSNITGNRFLAVVVNGSGNQGETTSADNVLFIPITINSPNLQFLDSSAPAAAFLNQQISVSYTAVNSGSGAAVAAWTDRVYLSDNNLLDGNDILLNQVSGEQGLASLATYNRNVSVTIPQFGLGAKFLIISLDDSLQQGETSNSDNFLAIPITLSGPDLQVTSVAHPGNLFSGVPFLANWTVTNNGTSPASGAWTDRVFLSDTPTGGNDLFLGDFSFTGTINAGQSLARSQSVQTPLLYSGNHFLRVVTDFHGTLPESDNTNNNGSTAQSVLIQQTPYPNLVIESVTPAFNSIDIGEQMSVDFVVKNTGTGPTSAPFWSDRLFFSTDQILDAGDAILNTTGNASFLNPGESYGTTAVITIPNLPEGQYYILVMADVTNKVNELDLEGDNVTSTALPIVIHIPPPPNMVVDSVQAPEIAFSGQQASITYHVAENGPGNSRAGSWADDVFMSVDEIFGNADDIFLGRVFNSRPAGQLFVTDYSRTATVNLPVGVSGDFFVFVKTDATNAINEFAFENDNFNHDAGAMHINLTPPPDLEALEIIAPEQVQAGRNFTIHYTVANLGATDTPNTSWTDAFYLSADNVLNTATDLLLGSKFVFGGLAVDEDYSFDVTLKTPVTIQGSFFLFVASDRNNQVFELDNANNNLADSPVQVTIVPPDLAVDSIGLSAATVKAGQSVTVQCGVTNQGTGDTIAFAWTDVVFMSTDGVIGNGDDFILGSAVHVGALAPGQSYDRSFNVAIPQAISGNTLIYVRTDYNDNVYEHTQEGNNFSAPVGLLVQRETADLDAGDTLSGLPALEAVNGRLRARWHVDNTGIATTNSNHWYDTIILSSDMIIGNGDDVSLSTIQHAGALASGSGYDASALVNVDQNIAGLRHVFVKTDIYDQVDEDGSEANNVAFIGDFDINSLRIRPDLAVIDVQADPSGQSGQVFNLSWTVRNLGDRIQRPASGQLPPELGGGYWRDSVYLSRDQIFDAASDIFLGQATSIIETLQDVDVDGQTVQQYVKNASFVVPNGQSGPFYVFVIADRNGNIVESNESNNVLADLDGTFISLAPEVDLTVGQITLPGFVGAGDVLNFIYGLINQGGAAAQGTWYDRFYLSKDSTFSADDIPLATRLYHTFSSFSSPADPVIGPGQTVLINAANRLPALVPGDYHLIVRADNFNNVPETDQSNNTGSSTDTFHTDLNELAFVNGVAQQNIGPMHLFNGQTNSLFFKFNPGAGKTLEISAIFEQLNEQIYTEFGVDHFAPVSRQTVTGVYIAQGRIPTPFNFDFGGDEVLRAFSTFSVDSPLIIPQTESGDYFMRVDIRELHQFYEFRVGSVVSGTNIFSNFVTFGDSDEKFQLKISEVPFAIVDIDTHGANLGNVGQATMKITASDFTHCSLVELLQGGQVVRTAVNVELFDSTSADVTFDLAGLAPGTYQVRLTNHDGSSDTEEVTIVDGIGAVLGASLQGPRTIRTSTESLFYVNYGNGGDVDGIAPLLIVTNTQNNSFALNRSELFNGQNPGGPLPAIQYLGIGLEGDPGMLTPGELGSVPIYFRSTSVGQGTLGGRFKLQVVNADDPTPIDWATFEEQVRPPGIDNAEWNLVFPRLQQMIGSTFGGYVRALAATASRLNLLGIRTGDVRFLFDQLFEEAQDPVMRTLSGYVVGPDCQIVADSRVAAYDSLGHLAATAQANDVGRYEFEDLPAGVYTILVEAEGMARKLFSSVTVTESPSKRVFELEAESQIIGSVTLGAGDPILAAIDVIAQETDHPGDPLYYFSNSDAGDAAFKLGNLPAGHYQITVNVDGYIPHSLNVILAEGQTLDLGTLNLLKEGSISGDVVSHVAGYAVDGAIVAIYRDDVPLTTTLADHLGHFTFGGLDAGNYSVKVANAPNFALQTAPIQVATGQQIGGITALVLPGGIISGTVINTGDGLPIVEAPVEILGPDGRYFAMTYTDASGFYHADGLELGVYTVMLPGQIGAASAVITDLDGQVVDTDLNFNAAATLSGQVLDHDGTPLPGAAVELRSGGQVILSMLADATGHYKFLLTGAGDFELQAWYDGASFQKVDGLAISAGQNLTRNLVSGSGSLQVTPSGSGLNTGNTMAILFQIDGNQRLPIGSGFLNDQGGFLFDDLSTGQYLLSIFGPNSKGSITTIQITDGVQSTANPVLVQQYSLQGDLTVGGAPISGDATVQLVSRDSQRRYSLSPTSDGHYSFTRLMPGEYDLAVFADGLNVHTQILQISADGTLDIALAASTAALTGRVVDAQGNPLMLATVTVTDSQGLILGQMGTRADGLFAFDGLAGREDLAIEVRANGYLAVTLQNVDMSAISQSVGDLSLIARAISSGHGSIPLPQTPPLASTVDSLLGGSGFSAALNFDVTPPSWLVSLLFNDPSRRADHVQVSAIPDIPNGCFDCIDDHYAALNAIGIQNTAFQLWEDADDFYDQQILGLGAALALETAVYAGAIATAVLTWEVLAGAAVTTGLVTTTTSAVGTVSLEAATTVTSSAAGQTAAAIYTWLQVGSAIDGLVASFQSLYSSGTPEGFLANFGTFTGISGNIIQFITAANDATVQLISSSTSAIAGSFGNILGLLSTLSGIFQDGLYPVTATSVDLVRSAKDQADGAKSLYNSRVDIAKAKRAEYLACLQDCQNNNSNNNNNNNNNPNNPNNPGPGNPNNPNNPNNPTPPGNPNNPNDPYNPVVVFPSDPNDITGPQGFGDENWIPAGQAMPYRIRFENVATATAPAQRVTITQQLDEDLDARTFRVDDFGWGSFVTELPANAPFFQGRLTPVEGSPFQVDVTISVDVETSIVTWIFQTIDPLTGEAPTNPLIGFLPPNNQEHIGEGFATYTIKAKRNSATGTRIDALATIIFDDQESLDTPAIFNTLDKSTPLSSVLALPASVSATGISAALAAASTGPLIPIEVSWAGTDEGSAIKAFDIYVSIDGGPFALWLEHTELTSATYLGEPGHNYAFYSVAFDNAGNSELPPTTPDASTFIELPDPGPIPTGVVVQNGMTQRSYVDTLRIGFSEATNLAALIGSNQITSAFTLTNLGLNADNDADLAVSLAASQFSLDVNGNLVWSLNSPGGTQSLADGFYELRLNAALITDTLGHPLDGNGDATGGDDFVFHFHRLEGDVNGDRLVSSADQAIVDAVYGKLSTDAGWNPEADLNRDNRITTRDRAVIARTIGKQVLAPASIAAGPADPIVFFAPDAVNVEVFTDLAGAVNVPFTTQSSGPVTADSALLQAALQFAGDLDAYRIVAPASGSFQVTSAGAALGLSLIQTGADAHVVASGSAALSATLVAGREYLLNVQGLSASATGAYQLDLQLSRFDDYLSLIGADKIMADTDLNGAGYTIAVIDTGINYRLPEFAGRVILGPDFGDNDSDPLDTVGHGTHVAGILASSSDFAPGIASQADLIALKITHDGSMATTIADIQEALQWVIDHQAQYHIAAINLSFGGGNVAKGEVLTAIEPLYQSLSQMGVFIATAAGNGFYQNGSTPGLSVLGASRYAAAVGAVWDSDNGAASWANGAVDTATGADRIASFSQRSAGLDLLAPGADILNLNLQGGLIERSGTSMAAPMVAAASVLIRQEADRLGRSITPGQIDTLLRQFGATLVDGDNEQDNVANTGLSYKRLDIAAAVAGYRAMSAQQAASIADASQSVAAGPVNSISAMNSAFSGFSAAMTGSDDSMFNLLSSLYYQNETTTSSSKPSASKLPMMQADLGELADILLRA